MKRILNILGTITLIGISITSLISCNKTNNISCEKENHGNWKQQCSNNKPFGIEDIKWYVIIWRAGKNYDWQIVSILNHHSSVLSRIDRTDDKNYTLRKINSYYGGDLGIVKKTGSTWNTILKYWKEDKEENNFKAVYRWDGSVSQPKTPIIDPKTGEVTDWKEVKEDK